MTGLWLVLIPVITVFLWVVLLGAAFFIISRRLAQKAEAAMGDPPQRTLWEMLFTLRTHSLSSLLVTMQRAESAHPAEHPMGSLVQPDWLSQIGLDPATFAPPPLGGELVDLTVALGPASLRPLVLSMPLLIAPMGYGIGLSAETKVALAQAASLASIAVVSGEGPFIPEERAYAQKWVLQESRGSWSHQPAVRQQADMIELQWGQGSEGGKRVVKKPRDLPERAQQALGGRAIIQAAPVRLEEWVSHVRAERPDCPLGVKIPATNHLETDLAYLCMLGVDVVTLDGAGAGSAGSPMVISDHFGVPTAMAAHRAHRWLVAEGVRSRVSLVVSGGIHGAADIARLLALGADAVMVGTELLFALLHEQVAEKVFSLPPTQLAFARSSSNKAPHINGEQSSEHAVNWLEATREELKMILRTTGTTSWDEFRRLRPLVARTSEAAQLFDIPFDGRPQRPRNLADSVGELVASYQQLNAILTSLMGSGGSGSVGRSRYRQ